MLAHWLLSHPSKHLSHPMAAWLSSRLCNYRELTDWFVVVSLHDLKWLRKRCCRFGSVSTDAIQLRRLLRDASHTSVEFCPLQTHTCFASSGWSHQGHLLVGWSFQFFIHFQTPHIPEECFVMKPQRDLGTSWPAFDMANPINAFHSAILEPFSSSNLLLV